MNKDNIDSIKEMIEKDKSEVSNIINQMELTKTIDEGFLEYSYKDQILIKYNDKNYFEFQTKDDAISSNFIDVGFLYEENNTIKEVQSLKFYSFQSIIKACDILNFIKPLVTSVKMTRKEIKSKGFDKDYKKSLFAQLIRYKIIKNIYIAELDETQSIMESDFINKKKKSCKLAKDSNQILSNLYEYSNMIEFYEFFGICFLGNKNNINKENKFFFINNKKRNEFIETLNNFFKGNFSYNILYILGPMSSGKSTTLIHFKNLSNFPIIYINLKVLNFLQGKEKLNIFFNETLLFFKDYNSQKKFFLKEINDKDDLDNIKTNEIIIIFVKKLMNKVSNLKLIIDQYKEEYDEEGKLKKELISIFKKNNNSKLLLSSSINDFDIREFIINNIYKISIKNIKENNLENIKALYVNELFNLNIDNIICSKKKKEIMKEFGFLPRMVNKILNIEEEEIFNFKEKEQKNITKKINEFLLLNKIEKELFFNAYFTNKENEESNQILNKEKFQKLIIYLPLKYFVIKTISDNEYKINSIFPLVDDTIEEIFVNNLSNLILKLDSLPSGLKGYIFEYAVINSIEKKYKNIIIKKVKNIYRINCEAESKIDFNEDFNDEFIYSIRQTNFRGNYYDFTLYFPKEKKLILIQISLHKELKDIITREILQENCKEIMKNINFENKILSENDIYFYYVIPNIKKENDPDYNEKMNKFVSYLNIYKYEYFEYNIEKNNFDNFEINFEKFNAKIFNNIHPVIKELDFLNKKRTLEIDNIKIKFQKKLSSKKYHNENFLEENEKEILNYFDNNIDIYNRFLKYCELNNEQMLFIIKKITVFRDIFLDKPFFLVMKVNKNFIFLHKVGDKFLLENLSEANAIENNLIIDISYIYNYKKYCLFIITYKKESIKYYTKNKSIKNDKEKNSKTNKK